MYLYLGNWYKYYFKTNSRVYCISTCCFGPRNQTNKMSSFKKRKFDPVADFKPDLHYYDRAIAEESKTATSAAASLCDMETVLASHTNVANNTTKWINSIPQGSGATQRVGNHYMIKSLQFTIGLRASNRSMDASSTYAALGWAIILDKKPPKTTTMPTFANIFKDSASLLPEAVDLQLNMEQRERYEILRTGVWEPKFHSVGGTVSTDCVGTACHVEEIFLNNLNIRVNTRSDTNYDLSHVDENAIYFVWRGCGSTTPTNKSVYTVSCRYRIRFYDV